MILAEHAGQKMCRVASYRNARATYVDDMSRKLRREARLVNMLPINQAALRRIEQAKKEFDYHKRAVDEVDDSAHVIIYLDWALGYSSDQETRPIWMEQQMQDELVFLIVNQGPVAQTRYFLRNNSAEPQGQHHLKLAQQLSEADNLQRSAHLIVNMFYSAVVISEEWEEM